MKPEITVNGQPIEVNSAVPTMEPTTEPTLGPTMKDPEPTLSPTVEPTTALPTKEPTLGPTFVAKELYGMETTAMPTFAPTLVPTDEPTATPTPGDTQAETEVPCLDQGAALYVPQEFEMAKLNAAHLLKSCDQFPDFKKSMRLVASGPHVAALNAAPKPRKASKTVHAPNSSAAKSRAADEKIDRAALASASKKRSVEDMTTAERRAFWLSHFAKDKSNARSASRGVSAGAVRKSKAA